MMLAECQLGDLVVALVDDDERYLQLTALLGERNWGGPKSKRKVAETAMVAVYDAETLLEVDVFVRLLVPAALEVIAIVESALSARIARRRWWQVARSPEEFAAKRVQAVSDETDPMLRETKRGAW